MTKILVNVIGSVLVLAASVLFIGLAYQTSQELLEEQQETQLILRSSLSSLQSENAQLRNQLENALVPEATVGEFTHNHVVVPVMKAKEVVEKFASDQLVALKGIIK